MRKFMVVGAGVLLAFALAAVVAGCAGNDERMTPVGKLVAEGGDAVSYRAPKDGQIYVYDDKLERLVYSGPIREGQVFSVDPRNKRLMLDGQVIQDNALDSGSRHKIYMKEIEPGMSGAASSSVSSTAERDRVLLEQGTKTTEYRKVNSSAK